MQYSELQMISAGTPYPYLKGMRIIMFQLSGFHLSYLVGIWAAKSIYCTITWALLRVEMTEMVQL